MDIQNNKFGYPKINIYFGYQKLLFQISETVVFGMHLFGYLKLLFWISEIVVFDMQNNYFGYQKLCQKGVLFEISK